MEIKVFIRNLHDGRMPVTPGNYRVDRASVLGNPFPMRDESDRDAVCIRYRAWLIEKCKTESLQKVRLREILNYAETGNPVTLWCWCAPKRCHAETIRDILLNSHKAREARSAGAVSAESKGD